MISPTDQIAPQAIISRALNEHISLPDILEPILKPLGDKYKQKIGKIYAIAQQKWDSKRSNAGIIYLG